MLALTPGPLYVPPAGDPPLRAVGPSMLQNVSIGNVTVTVGSGFTPTLIVEVFEHPFASVPVTVYVVADEGTSVTDDPANDPGIQVYVDAPLPVRVTPLPAHTEEEEAEAETVGKLLTVINCVAVFVHPLPSVPVTVYVVVEEGVTLIELPVSDPGIQVYVLPPDAFKVTVLPLHEAGADGVTVMVGVLTVTTTVPVVAQPAVVVFVTT